MSVNIAAQLGEAQVQFLEIISNYDGTIKETDVTNGLVSLTYYESVLDNTIRATVTLVDTGYGKNEGTSVIEKDNINLNSGEKINLKMNDGYGNQLYFDNSDTYPLRISEVSNIEEGTNKFVYTINLTSMEYHKNDNLDARVTKRFDGQIPDNVTDILKNNLKTEKDITVDEGLNSFSFTGKSEKPLYLCTWLAKRCVPNIQDAKAKLAGYLFYETSKGYQFKSIDKLFQQKPKRKLIYTETTDLPPGYDGKILLYHFSSTFNLKRLRLTGALGQAETRTYDPYTHAYGNTNQVNSEIQFNETNTGGLERIKYGDDQDLTTKRYVKSFDTGILPPGKNLTEQLKKSKDINFNIDEILIQSSMRYNSLFGIKLSMTIAGDFSINAGDVIHCDFPEVSSKDLKVYSDKKSGIYMVSDVAHRITTEGCFTSLNLVRDSIGRKPF